MAKDYALKCSRNALIGPMNKKNIDTATVWKKGPDKYYKIGFIYDLMPDSGIMAKFDEDLEPEIAEKVNIEAGGHIHLFKNDFDKVWGDPNESSSQWAE